MAQYTYSQLQAALPVQYRRLIDSTQRATPLLSILDFDGQGGDQMRWRVQTSGQGAAPVNLDGGTVPTATSDLYNPANLAYGQYDAACEITDAARRAAAADGDELANLWLMQQATAARALMKQLNVELYTGSGSLNGVNRMYGLGDAVRTTTSYAGIDPSTITSWVSTRYTAATGSELVTLDLPSIKHTTSLIATAGGMRPNVALCSPTMMDRVEDIVDSLYTKNVYEASSFSKSPGGFRTAGGVFESNFRMFKWFNQNLMFVEDPDCQDLREASGQTTSCIYFINTDVVKVGYIRAANNPAFPSGEMSSGIGDLPIEFKPRLGRTTFSDKADMIVQAGLRVEQRNACGLLAQVK